MAELATYYDSDEELSSDEKKRREICNAKGTFLTSELARASAIQAEWVSGEKSSKLIAYRCRLCLKWHLSSRE